MPLKTCILCEKRLKIHQRSPVNKHVAKYLKKNFLIETTQDQFICGKCSRPAYYAASHQPSCAQQPSCASTSSLPPQNVLPNSPPSIKLNIKTTSKSHAYCFICKKPGPKLIVVPTSTRTETFIQHNILITAESRCCPGHFKQNGTSYEENVISKLSTIDNVFLNRSSLLNLLTAVREYCVCSKSKRLSFDDLTTFSEEDMLNLTGISVSNFLALLKAVELSIRNTPARTVATTIGIFLFKLKSGLSNKVLSTLFDVSKSSVRRAIQTSRKVLMTDFVPFNLAFHTFHAKM
ncbi:hypothetical protein DPMN_012102 [Dreissena polymorpha]|uniref:Uncharacterized protein n=1 Tax=Dreissena polymorpha TaxID=45954 RepID=A0A9D4N6E3_DREPO|nr:hypothetical protein DPMN_012102 [Dreissena polymorpha]